MVVSGLRISWATPAAISPTMESFSDCNRNCSAFLRSEISLLMMTICSIFPPVPLTGIQRDSKSIQCPSLCNNRYSMEWGCDSNLLNILSNVFMKMPRSSGWMSLHMPVFSNFKLGYPNTCSCEGEK
ncbi:hypothetical protein D3C86_1714310 [compost metagenome]